jgi:tRNA (guanine-N7-)-methyltransferase
MFNDQQPIRRTIRSFVLREGRLTAAQKRALEQFWPRYGIDPVPEQMLDSAALFGRRAPLILEIGFGNGASLAAMAHAHPQFDFLGIEVHRPGIGHLLQLLDSQNISNVRVINADAVDVLQQHIADGALAQLNLFFPDPWPKNRHHKRRLVQDAFVELLSRKLQPAGIFHFATDWENYMHHVTAVMARATSFTATGTADGPARPATKFEQRGRKLGHGVWDLVYRRITKEPV